jgi:3-oxoacyl-[acyl-carrier-protein] synthase II
MGADRRVVVTGLGLVTASGQDEKTFWANLLAGRTGLATLRSFDTTDLVPNGGEVDCEPLDARQSGKLRKADRTVRFALDASQQALTQAGRLPEPPYPPQEIATVWGSAYGPCGTVHEIYDRFFDKGVAGLRPSSVPNGMMNSVSANVSLHLGLTGTNQVIASACSSSTNAIGQGFRMVRHGYADAVLCGGAEAPLDRFNYGVWRNLGVLSTLPEPERALRPFDSDRDGTLLGEGAAVLLLETLESAERRGVRIRGEIIGYGESSDATHITSPSVAGQARAIELALDDAGVGPDAVGYVNAHATATLANDVTEAASIRQALGDAADDVPVGALKSYCGHTLGASGAIESIATLLALEARVAPPNLNLDRPDPECRIRLVGNKPLDLERDVALKNSFGFGGGNGVLVFRRFA